MRRILHLHVPSPPSEAQQLLVLAGDEVDGGVLQQGREDKQQANGHPDVDGLYVGHLSRGQRVFKCHPVSDTSLLMGILKEMVFILGAVSRSFKI